MDFSIIFFRILRAFSLRCGFNSFFSSDGEDAILDKIVPRNQSFYYIDIGANHPVKHSNTFIFYLRGLSGICIDPLPGLDSQYRFFRPHDLFINSGISTDPGISSLPFYVYNDCPDNSTLSLQHVQTLKRLHNRLPSRIIDIPLITTSYLLKCYETRFGHNLPVHILSLDIEGNEYEIMRSFFDLGSFPWIVCVENIGFNIHTLNDSPLHNLFVSNKYIALGKTILSTVYVYEPIISHLDTPFMREIFHENFTS